MIPILYGCTETQFVSNGIGRLTDCISCIVTEERNGIYEVDFEYPVSGALFDEILPGRIIACKHDNLGDVQPFDIVSYSKPINGVVSFHGVHISYRQTSIVAVGENINSARSAFYALEDGIPANPFTYSADNPFAEGYVASFDGVPRSVRQILGGIEGSILDTFGGEYKFDKFSVQLMSSRGKYRDLVIRYGVNMVEYNEDLDFSDSYSACVPYWTGTDEYNNPLVISGDMVSLDSSVMYNERTQCVPLDMTDRFESKPTKAQLESAARTYLTGNQTYLPSRSIRVDFVKLQDTSEYAEYSSIMECNLCDYIQVVFPQYDMSGTFKIVKVEYDVLLERYNTVELGTLPLSLPEAMGVRKAAPFKASTSIGTTIAMTSTVGTTISENVKKNSTGT